MQGSVTLREEPARTVVYLRRQGAYAQIPDAITVVMRHVQQNRLIPDGPPIAVFHTDPRSVAEDKARWEVQVPIGSHKETEPGPDGVGVKTVAMRTLAIMLHVGPYHSLGESYSHVEDWIDSHGYSLIGPPEEAYLSGPDMPEEKIRTELRFPVALEPVAFGA